MRSYEAQQKAITEAIAQFPATFSLRAFPGDTFRVSQRDSYLNDSDVVTLYTERLCEDGKWKSFAKGSIAELKAEIVGSEPAKHLTSAQLSNARANQMAMAHTTVETTIQQMSKETKVYRATKGSHAEKQAAADATRRKSLPIVASAPTSSAPTVTIDAEVWKAVRFLIEGMAFMETVKHDHPELHRNVVKLARCVENAEVSA